ncbi:metallophosphoesterase [Candidatus Gracilibacteria bacterium]|nr:metallophosphoesterase [Candidatus Gracilibacteria bacterium]MCF7856075.1 metallophosphoesterase [Candidatus Gracilibacteria bacterium]MCF7896494.1 metallophosphoesterase [Candidatus Gracilibacteria bacterium]
MFFAVILAILLALHAVVYDFCIRAFSIQDKIGQSKVALSLLLLFGGFVGSFILARQGGGLFTKIISLSFGVWFGILLNLVWMILVAWLVIGAMRIFWQKLNFQLIGQIVIFCAVAYSLFGAWNVFHPVVKNVEIELKNLPQAWSGKTIVQISDLHLGGILDENFLKKVISEINQLNPEIVVITGDLLDGSADGIEKYINLLNEIKSASGTYFVTGNHEGYRGAEDSLRILRKLNIHILENEIVDLAGLQLIGISYPGNGENSHVRQIIEDNPSFDRDKVNVLLFHSPTSLGEGEVQHKNLYWKPNVDFQAAQDLGIDLQLSGHSHGGQIFPFTLITKWIYDGYEHGLHKINNFQIYISSGTGVWGPTLRTGCNSEIVAIKLK